MARISKGDFGKRHCNTEMSTVIPIDLKSALLDSKWKSNRQVPLCLMADTYITLYYLLPFMENWAVQNVECFVNR